MERTNVAPTPRRIERLDELASLQQCIQRRRDVVGVDRSGQRRPLPIGNLGLGFKRDESTLLVSQLQQRPGRHLSVLGNRGHNQLILARIRPQDPKTLLYLGNRSAETANGSYRRWPMARLS